MKNDDIDSVFPPTAAQRQLAASKARAEMPRPKRFNTGPHETTPSRNDTLDEVLDAIDGVPLAAIRKKIERMRDE